MRTLPAPDLVVIWRISEACALGCHFCAYSRTLGGLRRSADHRGGPGIRQGPGRRAAGVVAVDPRELARRRTAPVARDPTRVVPVFDRDLGLRQGLATAGPPLASARLRAMIIGHVEQLTISIDGLGPFHDRVRGCPGLFERLRAIVARLRSEDPAGAVYLRVNTVLMRGNIAGFGRFCEEMAAWGFHELTFNPLGGRDRPEFFPDNRLLPDQVRRFADELPGLRRAHGGEGPAHPGW